MVSALLRVARVTAGLVESNGTCRLTAKNWDQLWHPTLGNRVRATFTFLLAFVCCLVVSWLGCADCLQLPEISWNLKLLLKILDISWNLVDAPGKFYN